MRRLFAFLLTAALAGMAGAASAANPLVDVNWVKANIGKPNVVFIDLQPATDYLRGHIPGAVATDYYKAGWVAERSDKVPEMFPVDNLGKLADMIGKMGIDNNTHVVIVTTGAASPNMAHGTRIYWTFKMLGHDNVSLLNGGMAAYAKDKSNRLDPGAVTPTPKTFTARPRKEMLATMDDVKKAVAGGQATLVDNRPEDLYAGITQSPKTKQAGTLPGARNIPTSWLTVNNSGQLRDRAQLEKLYKLAGVAATSGEQIYFCNTAHLSSLGWFVSHELLGNKQAKLYDGSMAEWTILQGGPVEQKVKLQ
jgi:thiosulfate/3-mercaptopyruvate sulfurtransferase